MNVRHKPSLTAISLILFLLMACNAPMFIPTITPSAVPPTALPPTETAVPLSGGVWVLTVVPPTGPVMTGAAGVRSTSKVTGLEAGLVRPSTVVVAVMVCSPSGSGVDGGTYGICNARNAAGVTRSCSTDASNYLYIITSINSDSFVQFKWNASGKCTMLIVETKSANQPKQP